VVCHSQMASVSESVQSEIHIRKVPRVAAIHAVPEDEPDERVWCAPIPGDTSA